MPPKKSTKKSNDDDFDKLLAEASKIADVKAAKNTVAKAATKKETEGVDETAAPKIVSTADHPENPYPKPAKDNLPRQTWPEPTVPVAAQFKGIPFPKGYCCAHPGEINKDRESSEEKRQQERLLENNYEDLRHAAEVHRQVRTYVNSYIKPGMSLMTITDRLEKKLEELIGKDGLKRGQGFPTGVSLNHIAAHYTPNTGDKVVLNYDDVLKIDFGTHVNGRIVDSAWTVAFDQKYNPLLEAVREATYEGVKQAGIDVRINDIGAAIQEVMESYEIELNGKTHKVKSIRNLNGHSINPYVIHGGKSVPIIKDSGLPNSIKMEEGELYAIETFGSTGKGVVYEDGECSHYMAEPEALAANVPLRNDKAKALLKHIEKTYSTLPFCRKWLDRQGQEKHLIALNALCDAGIVNRCPPLVDVKGSYTAQFEHTFILKPTSKEVLSKGTDY